jgi:hypothetical protein
MMQKLSKINYLTPTIGLVCVEGVGIGPALHRNWKDKNMRDSEGQDGFIMFPTSAGGGALLRRSQIAGGRPNGQDGAVVYLVCGPSVYTIATIPQIARYLGAEVAELRRE